MIYLSKRIKFLLLLILCFAALTARISAAEGDLDFSFDGDGIVLTDNGSTGESIGDVLVQTDGKILAAGYSPLGSTARTIIARYNPNGSLDASFGTGGKVILESVIGGKLALQTNGKIIFAGSIGNSTLDFYVARLNQDGSLDATFNGTGSISIDFRATSDNSSSVKIQPDGKIIVGGTSGAPASSNLTNAFAIARLNADGSLDATFDGDGKILSALTNERGGSAIADLAVQPDGKILAAGSISVIDTPGDDPDAIFAVARYNADGSLDTTFDGDGVANPRFLPASGNGTTSNSGATNIFVKNDGRILVVGSASTCCAPAPTYRIAVALFNPDGSLDAGFDGDGKVLIDFPSGFAVRDAALQPDNKIVVAGTRGIIKQVFAAVARLNADGSIDLSFSGDGRNVIESPPNTRANAVALQPDGKIVIGGAFPNSNAVGDDFFLARFQASSCLANCFPLRQRTADFDGDGKTDLSVYRSGEWLISPSGANNPNSFYGVNFGLATDKLAPADYDGNGKTDIAVFRENPADPGRARFFILYNSNNQFQEEQFGATGDIPVPGYWDGDAKADLAVYRPGTQANPQGYFYYRPSSQPNVNFVSVPWGSPGDKPVAADFDGDGKTDAAVFRPSSGVWYVQRSRDGFYAVQFGATEDKPVVGDYDGDGRADLAVFRPSNGFWYILKSTDSGFSATQFGISTDRPVPGDYDGDGKTDYAVYRDGVWFVLNSANGFAAFAFGAATDRPVPHAFVQ